MTRPDSSPTRFAAASAACGATKLFVSLGRPGAAAGAERLTSARRRPAGPPQIVRPPPVMARPTLGVETWRGRAALGKPIPMLGVAQYRKTVKWSWLWDYMLRGTCVHCRNNTQKYPGIIHSIKSGTIVSRRVLALIGGSPSILQIFGLFLIPESPRWLECWSEDSAFSITRKVISIVIDMSLKSHCKDSEAKVSSFPWKRQIP
ncbi:hypothetical protein NL676_032984 [Syzygium grande]|nr:hypothetical protein NL676_032984 [Syzygium grande]